MGKEFLRYDTVRNDSIKLAHRIHMDGFVPDVIYVSLRGGAYMGNVISEYFKIVRRNQRPVFYAAVVARSYTDIHKQDRIMVDGWTYSPEYLRSGDKILMVDDIFDSGRTINHLVEVIMEKGIPRDDIRVAVHDFKVRTFASEILPIQPDYYCRKVLVDDPAKDIWIHYMSHELVGLDPQEIAEHYSQDPEVQQILSEFGSV
ncbi:MAG TPA: phosphoribosyltransferase family protein [Spirochaetia bacterium]|nr:phosphoribosyltransferase family protein [Spirochaetia bacterium]